jgi:hypothetical protein
MRLINLRFVESLSVRIDFAESSKPHYFRPELPDRSCYLLLQSLYGSYPLPHHIFLEMIILISFLTCEFNL